MRRRRPAPTGDTGASVVPLSRAHRVRAEDEAGTAGATALDRLEGTRSRFGELTNKVTPHPDAERLKQHPPRAPGRARRAPREGPNVTTGWTFVLVPPGADARPRTLRVSVRRLRFVIASFFVLIGSTVATASLLMLALNVMPPAQDEVRGVELGVFASVPTDTDVDAKLDSTTPASIAAGSAGAGAPRTTARPRSTRPTRRIDGSGESSGHSIIESLPVVGEITSRFARARRHPLLGVVRRHDGIDIAAPAGTHILAPAAGRVRFSGKKFGYGYTVEIEHGNGVITRYAHCRSLMVRVGDDVAAGAIIATVGRSGLATAPHLHYEVMVNGRNVNPLQTQMASLISGGKQPSPSAPPPPADSALRAPVAPDATAAPEEPAVRPAPRRTPAATPPPLTGDTVASGRIPTVDTPQVTVTESLPGLRPIPQVVVVDTVRRLPRIPTNP